MNKQCFNINMVIDEFYFMIQLCKLIKIINLNKFKLMKYFS